MTRTNRPRRARLRTRRAALVWWAPRALFVLGAVVLIVQSARGVPLPQLWAALAFFSVCSVIFVVRQLVRGHETGPGGESPRWLVVAASILCASGLALVAVYFGLVHADALPLVGAVLFLLGLGWIVEAWREAKPNQRQGAALAPAGAVLLGVAVLASIIAALLLPRAKGQPFTICLVVLGLSAFVVLPVGLNLLSERGLRALRRPKGSSPSELHVAGVAGVAITLDLVLWLVYSDWVLTAVLVGAVLVLLLAIVSNTHADVALVLASLCLIAAAPPEQPLPDALTPGGGAKTLVAMGDSYMSGEGAGSYFAGTDDAGGNQCRRAPSAYAVRAATQKRRFDRVLFLACSGARTYNVVGTSDERRFARAQRGEPGTQIDQLGSQGSAFHPVLVMVSLGGNDAGFGTIGEACLAPGNCDTQRALFTGNLPKVERALTETYRSLKAALPRGVPILAIPYPQPLADARQCSGVALSKSERDFVRDFVDKLDSTVQRAAANAGVYYLAEMKGALATHDLQLCERRKSAAGVNFLDVESVNGLASQRFRPTRWLHNSLHPNERGHGAMLGTLDAWLDAHPKLLTQGVASDADTTTSPPSLRRGSVAEPAPQCSMTTAGDASCLARVRTWELQQVVRLWPWMLVVLAGLVLLWAMSIAVVSLAPDRNHGSRPRRRSPSKPKSDSRVALLR